MRLTWRLESRIGEKEQRGERGGEEEGGRVKETRERERVLTMFLSLVLVIVVLEPALICLML